MMSGREKNILGKLCSIYAIYLFSTLSKNKIVITRGVPALGVVFPHPNRKPKPGI